MSRLSHRPAFRDDPLDSVPVAEALNLLRTPVRFQEGRAVDKRLFLWILVAALGMSAMPASADTPFKFVPASACDDPTTFQMDWDIYTHDADQESFDLAGSQKALRRDAAMAKTGCTTADERAFTNAYLYAWKAALDHRSGTPWQTDMNLALQLLEKCVTRHYGTTIGAQCQTDLETNIHRKLAWTTP